MSVCCKKCGGLGKQYKGLLLNNRNINMPHYQKCEHCNGTGIEVEVEQLSLDEVRTQFEKHHKQYNHPLDTYLDEHGIVCYTIYWIEAQWVGYQRMARDLDILREIE